MAEQALVTQWVVIGCGTCPTVFAIPKETDVALRGNHRTFYAPCGHSLSYPGRTDAQKAEALQAEVHSLERKLRAAEKPKKTTAKKKPKK